MTTKCISQRWWPWLAATLVVTGLAFAISSAPVSAQADKKDIKKKEADTKKKDAKSKDKTETKKEPKLEPPPANYPRRVDLVEAGKGGADQVAYIDEQILKGWQANKTYPSDRCSDYEFIRRATLDIIGRIPRVKEVYKFMAHTEKTRRSWLINELLDGKDYGNGAEYAQNYANLWTINLMTRTGSGKHYRAQMNDWLYNQLKGASESGPADWSKVVWELIASQGDTNSNKASVNYVLHNLGEEIKQDSAKNGKWDMVPATSRTTRLFLGIRTQCVQCHDHPFNQEWGQHHFWGINAFFRQVDTNGRPAMMMAKKKKGEVGNQEYSVKDNGQFNSTNLIGYERRNTVYLFIDPTFLNGKKITSLKDEKGNAFKGTRREALAKFITEDPFFAKAFVNRNWGHFFGKSFTKDNADDFGEHNPVSHPELLDKLAEDWSKKYKHNPKDLIRWICNSQAYGLSSRSNKWNDKSEDETLFARILLKPMTPEQMFESVMVATQAELKEEDKEKWLDKLTVNFGNDEGEEGSYSGTVIQALLLMNGQEINGIISSDKKGALAGIIQKRGASLPSLKAAASDIYMQVLSRPPTLKESADLMTPEFYRFRPSSKTNPNSPNFWNHYYQDIFWALLNSNEFVLNH